MKPNQISALLYAATAGLLLVTATLHFVNSNPTAGMPCVLLCVVFGCMAYKKLEEK